jgi:FixJ family two-component response regulator
VVLIAVVDDEESVRKAVIRLLRAGGYSARGFASGCEFLQNGLVDRPDCLVLDLQMPGLAGTDVQRQLNCAGAHLPVVLITAHDAPSVREECMRQGAVAYLCKPIEVGALLQAVTLAMVASH